jgi:hypothetical protein
MAPAIQRVISAALASQTILKKAAKLISLICLGGPEERESEHPDARGCPD